MDLLERYLQAVRFFLPRRNQEDIVQELKENLISQIEDREEELGRPLTEQELADILRAHGHPMLVAGRYRSHRQLIGPVFFPIYLFALKIGLGVALVVSVVIALMNSALNGSPIDRAFGELFGFPGRAMMVFAWTTLGFAALDFAQASLKLPHTWDPRSLPRIVKHHHRISRLESACELLFTVAGVVWLILVPRAPYLLLGPGAAFLDFAPIWGVVYVPILLLTVATAVVSFVNLTRPYWTPARSLARIAIHATSFLVWTLMLRAGEWIVARASVPVPDGVRLEQIVDIVNSGCKIALAVASIVAVIEIVRELRRLASRRNPSSPSQSPAARVV